LLLLFFFFFFVVVGIVIIVDVVVHLHPSRRRRRRPSSPFPLPGFVPRSPTEAAGPSRASRRQSLAALCQGSGYASLLFIVSFHFIFFSFFFD
jgi:hypothetical protein